LAGLATTGQELRSLLALPGARSFRIAPCLQQFSVVSFKFSVKRRKLETENSLPDLSQVLRFLAARF